MPHSTDDRRAALALRLNAIERTVIGVADGVVAPDRLPTTLDVETLAFDLEPYTGPVREPVRVMLLELANLRSYLAAAGGPMPRPLQPAHQDALRQLHTNLTTVVTHLGG